MKTIIKFLFALLILFAFSCSQEATLDPLPTDLDGVSAKANLPSDVLDATDGTTVLGSATIHRNNNGVTVNVKTSGLTPGYAYTLWIVAFNNPENCASEFGCNGGELVAAKGEVMYGAGHVVGGNGKGNFSAHLNENDVSGSINVDEFGLDSYGGLLDAQTAEVHIVVRCHGPAIPGSISEQIHSYNGGCTENLCADVQFAIFLAD